MSFAYHSLDEDDAQVEKGSRGRSIPKDIFPRWGSSISVMLAILTLMATATAGWFAGRLYSATHEIASFHKSESGWPKPIVERELKKPIV
jgi:hypothetical protein